MEKSHQWPQFLAVFLTGLLSTGSGIQMAWPSPSVPKILSGELGFNVTADEASYIVMLSPIGFVIGSPLVGILLDGIGRKYTLLTLAPIQILSWITVMLSGNVVTLYISRLMMGIADGGLYTAFPAYVGEIMEPKVRGVGSTSLSLGLLVGSLLINTYGSFIPIKTAACVSLAAPVLFLFTFVWMPESPYFFLARGADQEARKSLQFFRRMKNVEEELSSIKNAVQRQMAEPGSFRDIFTVGSNLKAFLILLALRTIQQLSGIYTIALYMQTIFAYADSILSPQFSSILCNAMRIPLTFMGSLMIDRFGRKIMLSSSSGGTALCLTAMAIYFNLQALGYDTKSIKWLPLVTMIMFYIFCSMGLLVVPHLMMGELLATNVKAKVLAILNMYFGLSMGAVSKLFQWTESRLGVHVPFYTFAIFCVFGVVFVYLFVPETKGKSLEEVQQILKGPKDIEKLERKCKVYTITTSRL